MPKMILLDDDDAATVKAILLTHAEMQDRNALEGEEVIARLTVEEPVAAADTIDDLNDCNDVIMEDVDNLRRIADKF